MKKNKPCSTQKLAQNDLKTNLRPETIQILEEKIGKKGP